MPSFLCTLRSRTHLAPLSGCVALCLLAFVVTGCDSILSSDGGSGNELVPISRITSNLVDSYPAWSPDGKTIAYTHWPQTSVEDAWSGGDKQIWLLDVATGRKRFLTAGWLPAWSPDGGKIAVVRGGYSIADIYTIELVSGQVERLSEWGWCFYPSWSPDGKRIAFDTNHDDPKGANVIWIMNADGSEKKDISQHGVGEWRMPAWSPDGSRIAHMRYPVNVGGAPEIFTMDTTGQEPVRLTFNTWSDYEPVWSPDGTRIGWNVSGGDTGSTGLWAMRANGDEPRRLDKHGGRPSWSPDGKQIVYQRWDEQNAVLWLMNADGSDQRPLTRLEDYKPEQQPDMGK